MRGQKLSFAPGDQLVVVGSRVRALGRTDVIAREIKRNNETFIFRDPQGKLLLTQW
jgi:hypothetical protein